MTKKVEACLPTDTLATAGEIMRRRRCGFVPVVDGHITNRVIGVLTDRDLALYLSSARRAAGQVQMRECMISPVRTVSPDATFESAARIMMRHAIHRLPVVKGGQLVGILSLKDIATSTKKRLGSRGRRQADRAVSRIIEAIALTR
jgi:CBS domain-containing protein